MTAQSTRTLASLASVRSRTLARSLATAREWTAGAVLLLAIPAAGCLSAQEALGVDNELRTVSEQIATLEADDVDGTPLTPEDRLTLQNLYSQREYLASYRRTFSRDQGPAEGFSLLQRFLQGDPTAIGTGIGAVVSALYGRKVYKERKAKRGITAPERPEAREPSTALAELEAELAADNPQPEQPTS